MLSGERLTSVCRVIVILIVSAMFASSAAVVAEADPASNERRVQAEQIAQAACQGLAPIPKLPSTVDPQKLCRSVLVENIDPDGTNVGVRAACEAALPGLAKAAAKYCAAAIDKILDPARKLFLDKVVPAAQQLACVTSTPAAFDCLAEQVHVWMKQSIMSLWQGLITVLTSDTKAITTFDGWRNTGVVALYSDLGSLGVTLLLGLVLLSLLVSVIRFDFRQFGSTLFGIVTWGLFWSGGVAIAVLLLKASDGAARWVAGRPGPDGQTDLARAGKEFGTWVDYVTGATAGLPGGVHPVYNPGSFTAILICLLLIVAIVVTLVALLMRNVALLLLILVLPLTLAGAGGPRMTRAWFVSAVRLFVALLLAKPLIVVAVRLGAVLVSVPGAGEAQATFSDALLGVTIILLAGLIPGVIYRFSGGLMQTSAGGVPRASGGFSEQSAHSVQSSMDVTRMIMGRNAPQPSMLRSGTGPVSGSTTAPRAGSSSGSFGAAAGPIGLAAVGVALAGSALESGGRWMAGHATTAGGVTGDVEAPKVPSPPITRVAGRGSGASQQIPSSPSAQPGRPAAVSVMQTYPAGTSLPAVSGKPAPLIIPGTVVPAAPDKRAEIPSPPKAIEKKADTP